MSGGSYDYVYSKIEDIELCKQDKIPERAAFQKLLKLVADAMHDIEWVDSCDSGPGDELEAINKCFSFLSPTPEVIIKAAAYDRLADTLKEHFRLSSIAGGGE